MEDSIIITREIESQWQIKSNSDSSMINLHMVVVSCCCQQHSSMAKQRHNAARLDIDKEKISSLSLKKGGHVIFSFFLTIPNNKHHWFGLVSLV